MEYYHFPNLPLPSNHRHSVRGRRQAYVWWRSRDVHVSRGRDVAHVDVMD